MGSLTWSMKRLLLLSAILAISLFSATASAQRQTNTDAAATTDAHQPTQTNDNDATTTNAQTTDATTDATTDQTTDRATQTTKAPSTTSTDDATTTSSESLPSITTSSSDKSSFPSLTKTTDTSIPTYPPPSPPPTNNAPFMNRSTMPNGTVFIAVGAILGAFGAAILVWRGIVACLLHRSVKKASMAQHAANDKASFPVPPAPFYKYSDRESTNSLGAAAAAGRGQRRTTRGPIPSGTPSQTNLFFSPTASGTGGGGMGTAGNRDSRFLPSGFYAATSASSPNPAVPGGGGGGHNPSISLSNLRPTSRGHVGPSPPDSPGLPPRGVGTPRNYSTSSFNLNNHTSGDRTPSMFLDDLLDEQPGAFPPGPSARSSYGRPPPSPRRH